MTGREDSSYSRMVLVVVRALVNELADHTARVDRLLDQVEELLEQQGAGGPRSADAGQRASGVREAGHAEGATSSVAGATSADPESPGDR